MPETHEESALVKKAASGDASAWAALVETYSNYVYVLLRSARVPDGEQADAFQYVFVELFKALPTLRNTERLTPWIRQTTLRHAIRVRDRSSRSGASLDDVEHLLADNDMVETLERAENALLVRGAIKSLPDRCRELVFRLFYDDPPIPYAELAEQLGIKVSSIGMTRQRCLDALEKSLRARGLS